MENLGIYRLHNHLISRIGVIIAVMAAIIASSCSGTDAVTETETANIHSYLKNLPRTEGTDPRQIGDSLYVTADGIYRFLESKVEVSAARWVQKGDTVAFMFDIREFDKGPSDYSVFSNIAERIKEYGGSDWPNEEARIVVGTGKIIKGAGGNGNILKGIDNALSDCQDGSKLALIIPSGKLFGNKAAGVLPANTALMYKIQITGINPE